MRWVLLLPLALVLLAVCLLYLPPVRSLLRSKATSYLQGRIGTPVELERLAITFPAGIELDGLLLLDRSGDTLLHAGALRSSVGLVALLNGRLEIGETELTGVTAHLTQSADSVFNFDYIIAAFASADTLPEAEFDADTTAMPISIAGLQLNDLRFEMDLAPSRTKLALRLGHMAVPIDEMDATITRIHAGAVVITDADLVLRTVSGPAEPDPYPQLTEPLAGLDIAVRELHLENIAFHMLDAGSGDSLSMALRKGDMIMDSMALDRQSAHFRSIVLEEPAFTMLVHNDTPLDSVTTGAPVWLDQHDGFRYWTRGFDLRVGELSVSDGAFAMQQGSVIRSTDPFDPAHTQFEDIGLRARGIALNDQELRANIEELKATAADNTALTAALSLEATPELFAVDSARITMDGTRLQLACSAGIGDPSNAYRDPAGVPIRASMSCDIDRATLGRLLTRFGVQLPATTGANERWGGHYSMNGTANDIDSLHIDLTGDMGTVVRIKGDAHGISAWPSTSFHMDVQEVTLGEGLHDVIASSMPAGVPMPGRFTLAGRFAGSGNGVDATLDMRSDLGDVAGTCSATGLRAGMPDAIDADLQLTNVALARFIGDTSVSALSAEFQATGEGLNTSSRSGSLHLVPSQLRYRGQDLSGTEIDARLNGDSIHADVSAHAQAMSLRLRSDAHWPAGRDTISGAIDLHVDRLGLKEFGWYEHPLDIHGAWTGNAAFSTDGFLAIALDGDSVMLSNTDHAFRFERFAVQARLAQDSTFLDLDSDALEVAYSTNVPVDSLLPRARGRALSFFQTDTAYVRMPGERMDLQVRLPRTEWLTDIVLPELTAIELKEFTGHYDGDADALRVTIDLPVLMYDDVEVRSLTVNAEAHANALDGSLEVDSAQYGSYRVKDLSLTAASAPGALRTELRVGASDGRPEFVVPIEFQRSAQEITLHVQDGLVLDTLAWQADPENKLRFTDRGPVAEHFTLSSGTQGLALTTTGESTTIELDHFDAGALVNIVSTTDSAALMDGELTGVVELPFAVDGTMRADLRIDDLVVTGRPMGDLAVKASGSRMAGYDGSARFENGPNAMDARVHYLAQGEHPDVQAHADLRLQDLSFLSPFVSSWLYELKGGLNGELDWSSHQGRNDAKGDVTFTNTVIGAVATGARYELRNERMLADGTGVIFDDFTVLDSLGTAFVLDGRIRTEDEAAMGFDLRLRTDSFRLMHRARSGSAALYGDLFTSADVRITGTDKAPVIKGELGVLPGTDLSMVMPGSKVELVRSEGIVEFTSDLEGLDTVDIVTNEERMRDSLRAQLPEVDMDLHLLIAPQAAFAVVLDPTSGDQATFKGTGDLRFRYTPDGEMNLRGPFTVSEGGYTLEFYGLVKKRFDLIAGSQVTWQGDPMSAKMDVRARYVSQSAAYPLVAKSNATMSDAQRNRLSTLLPFEVIIQIGGAMHEPDITFGIDLPREYRNSYSQVDAELDRLAEKSHEEDRNKQVFGLLVFNSFIQDEGSGSTSGNELATSAARNSINGILTSQLNKVGSLVKGVDVQLGVSTVDQTDNATTYQRTSLDYKVSKSFINDRLSFQVGGSVGYDEKASNAREVNDTRNAQYSILYDLTRDGRYQLRGFYENAFDLYDGEITDSGVAIMLTREFEENEKARERMREAERLRQLQEHKRKEESEGSNDGEVPASPTKP